MAERGRVVAVEGELLLSLMLLLLHVLLRLGRVKPLVFASDGVAEAVDGRAAGQLQLAVHVENIEKVSAEQVHAAEQLHALVGDDLHVEVEYLVNDDVELFQLVLEHFHAGL